MGVVVTGPELVWTALNGVTAPGLCLFRGWWPERTYHLGIGSLMTLFRRRIVGVSCSAVVLLVEGMRRMWH